MLKLHQQLNKIVEMLAIQRKKSSLTQPQVSLFDDGCLKYEPFQTALRSHVSRKSTPDE